MTGALAEACRLHHAGWSPGPIINSIRLDYPHLHIDQARAIVQYAAEACAAASLIRDLPLDHIHRPEDVPRVKGL